MSRNRHCNMFSRSRSVRRWMLLVVGTVLLQITGGHSHAHDHAHEHEHGVHAHEHDGHFHVYGNAHGKQKYECVHHKLKHEESLRSVQKYKKTGPVLLRRHSEQNRRDGTQPLRVNFNLDQLGLNIDEGKKAYITKVLVRAQEYIERLLHVFPVEGPLFVARQCSLIWTDEEGGCAQEAELPKCGTIQNIPPEHLGELVVRPPVNGQRGDPYTLPAGSGVPNTDLLVYVTASELDDICLQSEALAYANSCQRDQRDRPVVSYINFCSNKVTSDATAEPDDDDIKLALHELTHILGMSQSSYPFWREPDGTPRTQRCPDHPRCTADSQEGSPPRTNGGDWIIDTNTLATIQTDGGVKDAIVTPTVRQVVRNHFNCSELQGAELEDAGGEGTQLSHWEKRVFYSEYMTGSTQSGSHSIVSMVTLALLQDTGWYEVDFEAAENLLWGYGQGCPFVLGRCPNTGCSAEGNAEGEDAVCAFDRSAIGYCDTDPLMDGCTVVLPYINQECKIADDVDIRVRCDGEDCLGSYFGEGAACFESSLKLDGFNAPYDRTVSCYEHRCSLSNGEDVLEVRTPDGVWQTCQDGELLQAAGYAGRILCPATGQLCGEFAGPALPDAKELIPLNLDPPKSTSDEALDFITDASPLDWALYGGAGAGALGAICLCFTIYKWRKRSTSGVASMLGLKRNDRWSQNEDGPARPASTGALAFAPNGERRTSAEMEFEAAMRGRQVGELTMADVVPSQLSAPAAAPKKSSGCAVM